MSDYIAEPICIDELVTVMGQHDPSIRWNGWLCPRIDAWSCVKVIEAIAASHAEGDQPAPTFEWREDGVLVVTEYDGDTAYPEELAPDEDGLYSLGAWSWVWSRDTAVVDGDTLALLAGHKGDCGYCQAGMSAEHTYLQTKERLYLAPALPDIDDVGALGFIEDNGHSLDGEDPEADNARRAYFAAQAVIAYARTTGSDLDTVIPDLLGDLRHLVDALRDVRDGGEPLIADFDSLSYQGECHYNAEIRGEL